MSKKKEALEAENLAKFKPTGPEVTLRFDNQPAAELFLHWLSGIGEQQYWEWMEYREKEESGPITGVSFDYHNPGHGVVRVKCGRLDRPE